MSSKPHASPLLSSLSPRPPLSPPRPARASRLTSPCLSLSPPRAAFFESKRLENEKELMKEVPNWQAGASVYKSRPYMAPMIVFGVNDR